MSVWLDGYRVLSQNVIAAAGRSVEWLQRMAVDKWEDGGGGGESRTRAALRIAAIWWVLLCLAWHAWLPSVAVTASNDLGTHHTYEVPNSDVATGEFQVRGSPTLPLPVRFPA